MTLRELLGPLRRWSFVGTSLSRALSGGAITAVLLGACVGGAACPSHSGGCFSVVIACVEAGGAGDGFLKDAAQKQPFVFLPPVVYMYRFYVFFIIVYLVYTLHYFIVSPFLNLRSARVSRRPSHG